MWSPRAAGLTRRARIAPQIAHVLRAGQSFAAGVATVPGIDASRLWSEVQRVTTVQYQYGNEADVKAAREAVRGMIEGLLREHPKGSGPLYAKYAEILDVLGERQKAEEAFTVGRRLYPDDRELAAVASLRGFAAK